MFTHHGAVVAGKTGMTLNAIGAIQGIALSHLQVTTPKLGVLAAQGKCDEMLDAWRKAFSKAVLLMSACAIIFVLGIAVLEQVWPALATRFLSVTPTFLLCCTSLILLSCHCFAVYVRAFKKEPFLVSSIVLGGLNGFMVYFCGRAYGPIGAAAGSLSILLLIALPWIFNIFKRQRCLAVMPLLAFNDRSAQCRGGLSED
jgi:hypothetical protein